jgi:signal recognition particle subunit SRP54
MFESLTQRLSSTLQKLRGRGRLTEDNIRESLREVRVALLEADVALPVVVQLVERIKVRAVGQEVLTSLTPGPGADQGRARRTGRGDGLAGQRPQPQRAGAGDHPDGRPAGRGQDHDCGQSSRKHLKEKRKKKVMVVSADVYRPAAIQQLETLAKQVDALFFPSAVGQDPVQIVRDAIVDARKSFADVLIVDTAGRLAIDEAMMAEIKALHAAINPVETLFVVDAMTGQDAANTAKAFSRRCR